MSLRIASKTTLPPESVTETFAILGIRGSGKTNTAVVMAEELLKQKRQVVIIDPVDVWWGLKSSKDGKQPGFPIPIIGGEHADVPLDGAGGVVLADFVVDTRASVILALRHLSMNDQRRFAGDFAKRLYERKGAAEHRSPVMLIVDEADEFVPQRIVKGHEAMFGAFDRLVRRGRSSGIGVTLISQRPQVLNKDVLSQMEVLIAMRVLHKLDRTALQAWTEAHDTEGHQQEFLESLAGLEKGEAWIWSPSWMNLFQRVQIRARETFDSSATPKAGQQLAPPKELAPIDLEKLKRSMSAQIEKAKADDPKLLRSEIARLKAELQKKLPAPGPGKADPAVVERAVAAAVAKTAKAAQLEMGKIVAPAKRAMQQSIKLMREVADLLERGLPSEGLTMPVIAELPPQSVPHVPPPTRPPTRIERPAKTNGFAAAAGDLGAVEKLGDSGLRRMLIALAQRPQGMSAKQVGVRAYLSSKSGTFGTYLGKARSSGWMQGERSHLQITDAGLAALGSFEPLPTGPALLDHWLSELGDSGAGRMLRHLYQAFPKSISADELGEAAGISSGSGTFGTYLGKLRSLELVEGARSGLKASEEFFE